MATEYQARGFDTAHGAVFVYVQDSILGNRSTHTLYVVGENAVTDVDASVAQILTDADRVATATNAAFMAAGWTGGN